MKTIELAHPSVEPKPEDQHFEPNGFDSAHVSTWVKNLHSVESQKF
jgi:hypothetical protein